MFNKIFISIMFLLAFTAPAFSTISSTTSRMTYTGNGAVDTYSYTFKIFSSSDLLVTVRDTDDVETTLTLTTDYTVTGVGRTAGGTVVLVNSAQSWLDVDGDLKTGYTLSIRRVKQLKQLTDIRNQGAFYPEVHEDTFDGLVMIDQQQQDEIDRSMKLSETTDPADFSTELPASLVNNPGVTIIVNDAGDGFEAGPTADDIASAETNATTASAAATTASAAASAAAASAASVNLPSITGNSLNFLQANSAGNALQYTDLRSPNIGIGTVTPNAGKFTTLLTTGNVGIGTTTNPTTGRLIISGGNVGIGSVVPGQVLDVTGTVRATQFSGSGAVPQGVIVMWSGSIATIPTGWELSDGSCLITCPDLRNRFIVAADADSGGIAMSTVTGSALQTSDGQIPAHTHQYYQPTSPGAGGSGASYSGTPSLTTTTSYGTGTKNIAVFYALAYIIKD